MTSSRLSILSLLLIFVNSIVCTAQTSLPTRITGPTTPVHGIGNRPALDDGTVAFLGEDVATGLWGVYMAPADGSGPLTLIADENTVIPNVPEQTFLELDNPEVNDGVVIFTGGFEPSFVDQQGIYMGSGGPLTVYYDAAATNLNPNPAGPIVEGSDLVFSHVSTNSSGQNTVPFYMPEANEVRWINGTIPGADGISAASSLADNPSLGGGHAVLSARITHDGTVDRAVYTWDVTTEEFNLVADWKTQIPGSEESFDSFGTVDTDGNYVVFRGQRGLLGFGGHQGVYSAPVGAGGNGPYSTIAEIDQIAPDHTYVFTSFGNVAIDNQLVVFEAILGDPDNGSSTGRGIYAWRNGKLFRVIDDRDMVDGQAILDAEMNLRGLNNNQLVARIRFGITQYGIYVFNLAPIPGDVNQDGVVNLLDVEPFINLLTNGEYQFEADINQDGLVDLLDVGPFVDLLTSG